MSIYVEKKMENRELIFSIINENEVSEIETEYLHYKKKTNASPNSIERSAYSLCYYLRFLKFKGLDIEGVLLFKYKEQHEHFCEFLKFVKAGNHIDSKRAIRKNITCNMYLGDVLRFYQYLFLQYENYGELKVLRDRSMMMHNNMGVSKKVIGKTFKGYLKSDKVQGDTISEDNLQRIISACTNIRDKLIIMMFAETGFRLGELLGIDYLADINYEKREVKMRSREDNLNFARAKYDEDRKGYISEETYKLLMLYLNKYKKLIEKGTYLFVVIKGTYAGKPLKESAVYSMFMRIEKKTGIKTHPHAIRHYFATERWKNNWDLLLISNALGHKSIKTTINYLNIESEDLRSAAEKYYRENDAIKMIEDLI